MEPESPMVKSFYCKDKRVRCDIRGCSNRYFVGSHTVSKFFVRLALIEMKHLLQEFGDGFLKYFG